MLADVTAVGAITVSSGVVVTTAIVRTRGGFALGPVWFPSHLLVVLSHRILASSGNKLVQQHSGVGNGAVRAKGSNSVSWCKCDGVGTRPCLPRRTVFQGRSPNGGGLRCGGVLRCRRNRREGGMNPISLYSESVTSTTEVYRSQVARNRLSARRRPGNCYCAVLIVPATKCPFFVPSVR